MTSSTDALADFRAPSRWRFWCDLVVSSGLGWSAFATAVVLTDWPLRALAATIAGLAIYRAVCLLHEIAHLRAGALPGYELAWNLLVGIPTLLPSAVYGSAHLDHHRASTYGTDGDPEYLPLAGHPWRILRFPIEAAMLPIVLGARFLIAGPLAAPIPAARRLLEERASTLAMNVAYRRTMTAAERRRLWACQAGIVTLWGALAVGIFERKIPVSAPLIWTAIMSAIALINALRALAAHRYRSGGAPMDRTAQLVDSVDNPGGAFTGLWAPVGLRWHALHHAHPGIPYHHLAGAWARLSQKPMPPYVAIDGRGLVPSLRSLWRNHVESRAATKSSDEARATTDLAPAKP